MYFSLCRSCSKDVPDSIFLPISLWWYTMEAQHKWNQSSGSRLKQNSEKDLAPTPALSLFHCSYCCSSQNYRFLTFLKNTLSSPSPLVRSVFHDTCHLAYFFNGYNSRYGHTHLKFYNDALYNYADTIRYVRIVHGSRTPFESLVNSLSCF